MVDKGKHRAYPLALDWNCRYWCELMTSDIQIDLEITIKVKMCVDKFMYMYLQEYILLFCPLESA